MKRIDERTVELTDGEQKISDWFDTLLDNGFSIPEAVATLRRMCTKLSLSDEFWDWLNH